MKPIRLLPLVVFAAFALFLLKGIGLLTGGGYVLAGMETAQASGTSAAVDAAKTGTHPAPAGEPAAATDGMNGTNPAEAETAVRTGLANTSTAADAAERASESLFSRAGPTPVSSSQLDAAPFEVNKAGEKVPLASNDGTSTTEKAVLERLSDRRAELDAFENQLKQREALVAAAEMRLNERVEALKALEAKINALVEQKKAMDDEQFKGLVSMYENMKPKDAAAIFDQLSSDVLFRVATAMNPRKMSPILAAMTPTRAQELTTMMAAEQAEPSLSDASVQDLSQLPQIVGQ